MTALVALALIAGYAAADRKFTRWSDRSLIKLREEMHQ